MTTYAVTRAKTATLVGATEDKVQLAGPWTAVDVVNLGAAGTITVAVYPLQNSAGAIAADANDLFVVNVNERLLLPAPGPGGVEVRLVSAGTPKYHVCGMARGAR